MRKTVGKMGLISSEIPLVPVERSYWIVDFLERVHHARSLEVI